MAKSVEGVYSEALFELAAEKGNLPDLREEVYELYQLLKAHPEFGQLLTHPRITREEKTEVVKETFAQGMSEDLKGFLLLLVEKDRTAWMKKILRAFLDKAREELGICRVKVRSATELSEDQKKTLEEKILKDTHSTSIEMHYAVDPGLIGGMIISIGDRVVDNSLKTKLLAMERDILWKARMDYLRAE